jgi:uncharacterized protein (DUF362 family)
METPRIFIAPLESASYAAPMGEGLAWLGAGRMIGPNDHVCIKPNLTFPVYRKGVMTNPECVEALIVALKDYTGRITVVESDSGGYNRFDIGEVQRRIGLKDMADRYGVRIVNLSRLASRPITFTHRGRQVQFGFPSLLMEETDVMVSAAVPKIHMNTGVSMTVKNLWGCIPEPPERLKLHPCLPQVLLEITRVFPRSIAVVDGRYGLNRSGPMEGDAVQLNWLLMGTRLYAADRFCCRLIGWDPQRVAYLNPNAGKENAEPEVNCDWMAYVAPEPFFLKRAWTDVPGCLAFHSRFLSWVAYFSPWAAFLHWLLYLFRQPFYDYDKPEGTSEETPQ